MLSSLGFSLFYYFFFAHYHKRYVLLISNPSYRMKFEALITKSPRKRCETRAHRIAWLINFKTGHKWKQSLWAKQQTALNPQLVEKFFWRFSTVYANVFSKHNANEVLDIIAGFHFITSPTLYKFFNRSASYFQTTITMTTVSVIHKFHVLELRMEINSSQLAWHCWLNRQSSAGQGLSPPSFLSRYCLSRAKTKKKEESCKVHASLFIYQ